MDQVGLITQVRVDEQAEPSRVLFVDDEPHVLAGLRRMLRPQRDRWEVSFASSGAEALLAIQARPVDAIITDMRMPGMDGSQLLAAVQRVSPSTVRIILSGQADRASVLAAVGSAQQFLAKPCDPATLTDAVERALDVRRRLSDPALRELIGGVVSLPVLPAVYRELMAVVDEPEVDLREVARILSSDVATSAEVLKLVNSAFFGLPREVSSVESAVSLLGLDNIEALVVAGAMFRTNETLTPVVDVEGLRAEALQRAAIGRTIAAKEGWPQHEASHAVLSCMLRDVGELVLAEGLPARAAWLAESCLALSAGDAPGRAALELEAYGCGVPQASAYLLGLWGFASAVVRCVATQPLTDPGPGTTRGELVLDFAHRRIRAPLQTVDGNADGYLDPDRAALWNSAFDEVAMP